MKMKSFQSFQLLNFLDEIIRNLVLLTQMFLSKGYCWLLKRMLKMSIGEIWRSLLSWGGSQSCKAASRRGYGEHTLTPKTNSSHLLGGRKNAPKRKETCFSCELLVSGRGIDF